MKSRALQLFAGQDVEDLPHVDPATVKPGHAFVLGSGIAGLSMAEILSRNGWRITLLDDAPELGGDASRSTQDWLHTGWLYAALPYEAAMLDCHRALQLFRRTYDRVLPPGVVNLEVDDRGVRYPESKTGWFSPQMVHYLYSIGAHELSHWEKLMWHHYLDWIPLRRLRHLGYSTEPVHDVPPGLLALMNRWEHSPKGHEKYRVVQSTDARIDTHRVLSSLLSLLGEKTQVVTSAKYELTQLADRTTIRMDGEDHTPDLVVMGCGKGLPRLLRQLRHDDMARRLHSVKSPIVVLKRALDLPNFIRFTPELPETVNHIKYPVEGAGDVSTIGSYDSSPVEEQRDIAPFVTRVCDRLDVPESEVAGAYFGTKTELTGELARCYNHALERVNSNTFFAVAGKFSQFPVLVHTFAAAVGLRTDITNEARGELRLKVAPTAPERVVGSLAAPSTSGSSATT